MDSFVFVRPTGTPFHPATGAWAKAELDHATEFWRRVYRGEAPVKDDVAITDADLAKSLGIDSGSLEGRLFPDTYLFTRGSSERALLARALRAMDQHLEREWSARAANLQVRTPYEALVLASIIEKETGSAGDRKRISGVFHNRLRIGMRLQTDPTVIYGMGAAFDGDLRRRVNELGAALLTKRVSEVMTARPSSLASDALVRDAVQLVRERRLDEIPVVDGEGRPLGLIDVQDLVSMKVIDLDG
jgi:CBS domain-containing protein